MAMKKSKRKGLSVNFEGVESGGKAVPDGHYPVTVESVELTESSEGNEYLKWVFKINAGPSKGAKIWDNTSLQPQALWRLKGLLEVLGEDDLDGDFELDTDKYVGEELALEITNEEYQGKEKPRVTGFLAELPKGGKKGKEEENEEEEETEEEEAEEEEAPAKPAKKKKAASKDDDDDESELKKGSKVTFKDENGRKQSGKIVSVDGDTATVDVKGEDWELDISDLEAA